MNLGWLREQLEEFGDDTEVRIVYAECVDVREVKIWKSVYDGHHPSIVTIVIPVRRKR